MMDRLDRTKELLMRALDDELSPEERSELDLLLADDPILRAERERLGRLKEVTGEMKLRNPPEQASAPPATTIIKANSFFIRV